MDPWWKSIWRSPRTLGWVLLLAAVIRFGYAFTEPLDERDAIIYRAFGHHLAEGKGFVLDKPEPDTRWPPLVAFVLAGIYLLGGNEVVAREVWALMGVITVWVTFRLVRERHGLVAANVAALGVALYPYHVLMGGSTSTEVPNILLLTLGLLFIARWRTTVHWKYAALLGLSAGLAILTRPAMIFFVVFAIGALLIGRQPTSWSKRLVGCALMLVAVGVVIAPWCVRTSLLVGKPSPPVTAGPAIVWEGNNPWLIEYMEGKMPSPVFRDHMLSIIPDPGMSQIEKDRAFRKALRDFVTQQPAKAFELLVYKTIKFWQIPGLSTVTTVSFLRQYRIPVIVVGCIAYVPLVIICVIGTMGHLVARRPPRIGLYLAWIVVAYATNILGASVTRYRFASGGDQMMIIIAAVSLAWWFARDSTEPLQTGKAKVA